MDDIQKEVMDILIAGAAWFFSLFYLLLLFVFVVISMLQFHLLLAFRRRSPNSVFKLLEPNQPKEWPFITVQLPIFNELSQVTELLTSIAELEYPTGMWDIQVLDDSTDETTTLLLKLVAEYQHKGLPIHLHHRSHRKGYKAGALQEGLNSSGASFIAIFDADYRPSPDFFYRTIPHLIRDEKLAVVQTCWGYRNATQSLLTRLQVFQLNVHFKMEQTARFAKGLFLQFNGTGGIWRRQAIDAVGGWENNTLTEDLDLSYRVQLEGWKICYLEHMISPGEVPADIHAFRTQQFRWMKGGAETARKLLRQLWISKVKTIVKVHGTLHLLSGSIYLLILLTALSSIPLVILLPQIPLTPSIFLFFMTAMLVVILIFYASNQPRQKGKTAFFKNLIYFTGIFPCFIALSMGLSFQNSIAVLQGWRGKTSPFVRTPKSGKVSFRWRGFTYAFNGTKKWITLGECCLFFLFGAACLLGLYYENYFFIPYHFLLFLGFGSVFIITLLTDPNEE